MSSNFNRKYKRPNRNTAGTTNPQATKKSNRNVERNTVKPLSCCSLLAKDSEWLDGLQASSGLTDSVLDEEEVLQLVECEDGPEMKPLTVMFPGLLEKDPQTLQDMLNKKMSTTEMTRHLLGQKADFSLMKKVNRLIPSDKTWLEPLTEDSNSISSVVPHTSKESSVTNGSDGSNVSTEINNTTSTY